MRGTLSEPDSKTASGGHRAMPLLLPGVIAFVLFALLTLPAPLATRWLATEALRMEGVSGTLWHGRIEQLYWQELRLGQAEWQLQPAALLTARLRAQLTLARADGFARTTLTISPTGRLRFNDLVASLPLSALPVKTLAGWNATLNLRFTGLLLDRGWPIEAAGRMEAVALDAPLGHLVGGSPDRAAVDLGSYQVEFAAAADTGGKTVPEGVFGDTGGPLQVTGSVLLRADRSYLINGLVALRAGASRDIAQALRYLGPADAQGRRAFSLEGSL